MIRNKLILLALSFLSACTPSYAATDLDVSKTYSLNGGLNLKDHPTKIADNQSPDMVNFVSDNQSTYPRNGTQLFNVIRISSFPVHSLHKSYSDNGTSVFIAISTGGIFVSTITDSNTTDVFYSTFSVFNSTYTFTALPGKDERFEFADYNNKIIMVSHSTIPLVYDIYGGSVSVLGGNLPACKLVLVSNDYLLIANSTSNPRRVFFSNLADINSFPTNNYFDLPSYSGESITGMTTDRDGVNIFMENSVWKLNFTILSSGQDGNETLSQKFQGGCIAYRSLINFGDGIFYLAKDGCRISIGGTSLVVSDAVEPLISRLISSKKYVNSVSLFDKKNKWIWLSFEDTLNSPVGVNNTILIYDLKLGQWYKFKGINVNSFSVWDGANDNNRIFAGDSEEGKVYELDVENVNFNNNKSIQLCGFETDEVGFGVVSAVLNPNVLSTDTVNYIEGKSSVKRGNNTVTDDYLGGNNSANRILLVERLRRDLYVLRKGSENDFLTIRSKQLKVSNSDAEIRIKFWMVDGSSRVVVFSSGQIYGNGDEWKFCKQRIGFSILYGDIVSFQIGTFGTNYGGIGFRLDDMRIETNADDVEAYRYTKPFDLDIVNKKTWSYCYIGSEMNPDSNFIVDVISNRGKSFIQRTVPSEYDNVIYITSGEVVTKIGKDNYNILVSSYATGNDISRLAVSPSYLYGLNKQLGILYQMELTSMTLVNKVREFSSGDSFSSATSLTTHGDKVWICDTNRNRILEFNDSLVFISSYGNIGLSSPTSITTDGSIFFIYDEGNNSLINLDMTFSILKRIKFNNIGSGSISINKDYLIVNYISPESIFEVTTSSGNTIQLRDKFSLEPLREVSFRNQLPIEVNSDDDFIISTSSNPLSINKYRISDLALIDYNQTVFGDIRGMAVNSYFTGDDLKQVPLGTSGRYMQLRYRVSSISNRIKIYDQTFVATKQELR